MSKSLKGEIKKTFSDRPQVDFNKEGYLLEITQKL